MRFFSALVVVVIAMGVLVYSGVRSAKKTVVTVSDLVGSAEPKHNVRLGARVASDEMHYQTTPSFLLQFAVNDIKPVDQSTVQVEYHGIMPDTLQPGRDVILEGDYNGYIFLAKNLLTQCPSKYEPPLPQNGSAEATHRGVGN